MLKVQAGESIHSLIFRTHCVYGIQDYSNIILSNGSWAPFPKILHETLFLYKPVDEFVFLSLLRDIGIGTPQDKLFSDPFCYQEELKIFFGGQDYKRYRKSRAPLKYCLACILEFIQDYGVGFFKVEWNFLNRCKQHAKPLCIAISNSRKETLLNIKKILSGQHAMKFVVSESIIDNIINLQEYYHEKKIDYFSECLVNKIKEVIVSKAQKNSKLFLGKNYSSTSCISQRQIIESSYFHFKHQKPNLFNHYWKKFVTKTIAYTGVINKSSICESIYKFKKSDCQRCLNLDCSANLAIIPIEYKYPLIDKCKTSQINLWYAAYSAQRNTYIDDAE